MRTEKKVLAKLNKCYALGTVVVNGRECFLAASEQNEPCYLFTREGEFLETVWESPGGVMTIQSIPGREGAFLATHAFYSPDNSLQARLVLAERKQKNWSVRTLCKAPFLHRFGILARGGVNYLLLCCLKSGHEFEGDWRFPGAVYTAELSEDLSAYDDCHPLPVKLLMDGMLENHGYSRYLDNGVETGIVGCRNGVYQFIPPENRGKSWQIHTLVADPSSDAVLMDFDGDGEPELGSISPFHGDTLRIYHKNSGGDYVPVWEAPDKYEFLHATWPGKLFGKPAWFVGSRAGDRLSMVITWQGKYTLEVFDKGAGAANALMLDESHLVMANRETDEVALYTFFQQ